MKIIEPVVLDTDFNKLGIIDSYISLIWTSKYYDAGDFEICMDINDKNRELIKKDYYIMRNDDENTGIIENIEIVKNEDQQEMVIIKGRFLTSILGRRIIADQTVLNTTVSAGIAELINRNITVPVLEARKIENFIMRSGEFSDRLNAQYTGKNLLEVIKEICLVYGIGFNVILNDKKQFEFYLYKGVDRSYNQTENKYIIFSDEYDNLKSANYIEDYGEIVTDVLVAGEGEGAERRTLWVSKTSNIGLSRHEFYKDQRNISSNNGEISESEYNLQLREEGLESLTTFTNSFEGQVYFDNIEYKKDLFLGDVCVIENSNWDIYINTRLVEVIESIDESGTYSINPTFGA